MVVGPRTARLSANPSDVAHHPCLGLGTAAWIPDYGLGGPTEDLREGLKELVCEAVVAGIRYIDTAASYDAVEERLGQLAEFLRRHHVRLCTKLAATAIDGLSQTLQRLRCERVDTVLVHNACMEDLMDHQVGERLIQAKRQGHVGHLGASTYGGDDARMALQQPWCEVIQVEHSLLHPTVVHTLAGLKRPGQELVVRSVLCKGLLTSRRRYAEDLPADAHARLDRLEEIAAAWDFSLPELAIRFALDTPAVDIVLVGISDLHELETALAAAQRPSLEPWQRDALKEFDCSTEDWSHPERWGPPT